MSLRALAILLVACGALAAVIAISDPMYRFMDWLRFTLVAFAVGYLIMYFRKRRRTDG